MDVVKINQINIVNTFFSYSEDAVRVFNCNEIFFENLGELDIMINDVYILRPGKSIYITARQNEIDTTPYKFTFTKVPDGPALLVDALQGWYKMDAGVTKQIQEQLLADSKAKRPNRMRKPKAHYMNKQRR